MIRSVLICACVAAVAAPSAPPPAVVQLVFTSDAHYGITRPRFRGNPHGTHDINAADKFENLLSEEFSENAPPALETFVAAHPTITAYFHGHSNFNQFYDWTGPHHSIALHAFRVDSPMKGAVSKDDETKLSFQIETIDTTSHAMTVREVLWNEHPDRPALTWGASTTVVIGRREKQ